MTELHDISSFHNSKIHLINLFHPKSLSKIKLFNRNLTANFTGIPAHLRGREFIYRNANNLHVSEFQAFVKTHLMVCPQPVALSYCSADIASKCSSPVQLVLFR